MPTHATSLRPPRDNRGGPRPGAGRKSQWPTGTAIKTMRFPAVLEDELRQYARKRMAELQRAQARADARQAAGPPPELKQVHMAKIDARHFTIVHGEQSIGDVSCADDRRWLACLYGVDGDHAFAWGKTRRLAVTVLLSQERTRWLHDDVTSAPPVSAIAR